MPVRIRARVIHSLRFALPTIISVYLLGALWNAADVFLLDDADPELGRASTFWFDERQWRIIALVVGAVVFLWKLGDISRSIPSWRYALLFSLWLAVASVWTAAAMMEREGWLAAGGVLFAVVSWLLYRRRLPGRPTRELRSPTAVAAEGGERDLR